MSNIKKSKKPKAKQVELDESDYLQGLDYAYVMMVAYHETLIKCEVINKPPIAEAFAKVGQAMADLYQVIGQESAYHDDMVNGV